MLPCLLRVCMHMHTRHFLTGNNMCVPKAANTMAFSEQKVKYVVCCQPLHCNRLKQFSTQLRKRISKPYVHLPLFVFLAFQPIMFVFSQPGSGL